MDILSFLEVRNVADGRCKSWCHAGGSLALCGCFQFVRLKLLNSIQSLFAHFSRNLWSENESRLLGTNNRSTGRIRSKFVGGSALIGARIFTIAVENVEDDNSKVMEGSETMTRSKRLAIFIPFSLLI